MRIATKMYLVCLLGGFCLASSARVIAQDLGFVCNNNGATRSVEVVSEPGYACRVKYTKPSGTTYPWNARKQAGYCGSKALFLVERLKSWGWECDSAEDVRSVLAAQIERYHRHIKILNHVGKRCHFYPGDVQFGDLCGDVRQEGVVVYSCEVDNGDWDQHLAVFLEIEAEPLILEIGGSRSRQVTSYYIDDRRLVMESQPFDDDAGSSPPAAEPQLSSIECRSSADSAWELREQ